MTSCRSEPDPTGMFDMTQNSWSAILAEAVGVHINQLPVAFPPGSILGTVTDIAAKECGLPEGLPVIAGIGDGQISGLGVNITQPGDAYLALGTSVVSGAFNSNYVTHPAFRTMYGGMTNSYILETAIMGGGYTITWFNEHFARNGIDYESQAINVPPGCQGLILVPYWNSVLSPYWDAAASGITVGWRGHHTTAHLYRAILEGVAFEQRLCTSRIEQAAKLEIQRYVVVGGGARSNLWCQIVADITGKLVARSNTTEASALGAGILAAYGAGWYPDVKQAAQAMTTNPKKTFQPNITHHEFYSRIYEDVYSKLFPAVQTIIDRIPNITANSE